jgi:hypothetical protein
LDPEDGERLVSNVLALGKEFRLDPETLWHTRSPSGALIAGGMHHSHGVIGARRYVAARDGRVVLFDGLPIDATQRFSAHDAEQLDDNWSSAPKVLEGQFCAVSIDLVRDQADVLTDPLGILPVFCGRRGGALVASSSAALVASVLRMDALDPLAIAAFVALGWAVERRTFITGITALPGGSVHTLTAEGLRSAQHFGSAGLLANRAAKASTQELRAQLVALSSGAARAGGAIRCALTAGHDTRVLAALLRATGLSATYYTGGDPSSMDVLIGGELAGRFGLAHEVETPNELTRDWTAAASRFVRQNDGLSSLSQLGDYIELMDPVKELRITFWGVGGEIGRAGTGALSNVAPNLPIVSRLPEVQRRLLALKVDDQGLLTEHGKQLVIAFLNRFVEERLREGWPTREITEAFYAFERVASWGSTGPRRAAGTSDLFSPYCTRPFINYCFSLRPSERYLEAPHHRLLVALDRQFLEHRFEQPFHPQHPAIVGMLATRQLLLTLRSRQRHGAALPASADGEPPFLDRWLDVHADLLQTMSEKVPPSMWELIDRTRFIALLAGSRTDRIAYRDTLLRIATPLWWLAQPGETQQPVQGVVGPS